MDEKLAPQLRVSATAMQIANDVPWFGTMKCQRTGHGSARCSVYGFGELASNINDQKKDDNRLSSPPDV